MRLLFSFLLISAIGCDNNNSNGSHDMAMNLNEDMRQVVGDGGCIAGSACMLSGGANGICKSGACAACVDTTDDATCDGAYSDPTHHYICSATACAVGCRTSAAGECQGQICGVSTPNVCGACTADSQCQMAFGAGQICNVGTGKCQAGDCTNTGFACSANSADICCSTAGGSCTTGTCCYQGGCCTNSDCGDAGLNCVNHVCTNCPSAAANLLVVDPSEIPGGPATGADVPGCRFKTITSAMNVATPGTTIKVLGTATITGDATSCANHTGECFGIAMKPGVSIVGDDNMFPNIVVPSAKPGFLIQAGSAGCMIKNLNIDGYTNGAANATSAIQEAVAGSPSPSPFATLNHVAARRFLNDVITVNGGLLTIQEGTQANESATGNGLGISAGNVTITGGTDPITFNNNNVSGVRMTAGTLTMTGTAGNGGSGTITCNLNAGGISLLSGTTSNLTGVVAWSNSFDGVDVTTPAQLVARSCSFLKNGGSGINILKGTEDVTGINLGDSTSNGLNQLQDPTNPNVHVGICNPTNGSSGTLMARGNKFEGLDCTSSTQNVTARQCDQHGDIGPSPGPYNFDVSTCNLP